MVQYRFAKIVCAVLILFLLPAPYSFTQNYLPKTKGWTVLFDSTTGIDLWKTYKNKPQDSWLVADGLLYDKSDSVTQRADLVTKKQYANFELFVEWKIAKGENSGIIYRANEDNDYDFQSGPEYQLIDDIGYPEKLEDWQRCGADYDMHPPMVNASKPAGEWNTTVIKVVGDHAQYWLNGKKTADFRFWTDDWNKKKAASKWKDDADYGMMKTGYVCLQDHGGGIWFKTIKIKEIR